MTSEPRGLAIYGTRVNIEKAISDITMHITWAVYIVVSDRFQFSAMLHFYFMALLTVLLVATYIRYMRVADRKEAF